jgi:hypothetical protein
LEASVVAEATVVAIAIVVDKTPVEAADTDLVERMMETTVAVEVGLMAIPATADIQYLDTAAGPAPTAGMAETSAAVFGHTVIASILMMAIVDIAVLHQFDQAAMVDTASCISLATRNNSVP